MQAYPAERSIIIGDPTSDCKLDGSTEFAGATKVKELSAAANISDAPARDAPEDPLAHHDCHALHNRHGHILAVTFNQACFHICVYTAKLTDSKAGWEAYPCQERVVVDCAQPEQHQDAPDGNKDTMLHRRSCSAEVAYDANIGGISVELVLVLAKCAERVEVWCQSSGHIEFSG